MRLRVRSVRSPTAGRAFARNPRVIGAVMTLAALAGTAATLMGLVLEPVAGATTAHYFSLSVTPTQNVVDGQSMTVTVTRTTEGTAANLEITSIETGWCTVAAATVLSTRVVPNLRRPTTFTSSHLPTLNGLPVHCTTRTHSLNSDTQAVSVIAPPENTTGDYPTVTGSVIAESTEDAKVGQYTTFTLTCDAGNPCAFVVAVFTHTSTGAAGPAVLLATRVTYLAPSIASACGGAAPGALNTVAPTRLGQMLTTMDLDACVAGLGGGGALTGISSSGESEQTALESFATGVDDLAYSAVGYRATAAFTPTVTRPYVAVPIALNAVVLAHPQTASVANPYYRVYKDYPQLKITIAQAAQLLGGGGTLRWSGPLGRALASENPTFTGTTTLYGGGPSNPQSITAPATRYNGLFGVAATSLTDATSLFATTFLHALAPSALTSRKGSASLGVTADLGTATPPYNVAPATGLPIFRKDLTPGTGLGFALTNRATAAATWGGLSVLALQTPGSIGSATPKYVVPTPASMYAAVPEMIPQPDGTLLPNPDATVENGAQAYPLTYVEYAIAPAQPLLTPSCQPRTQSQQDLTTWLRYITGAGQSELPSGFVPLTPSLQAVAQAAIAKVGTATPTGSCAPAAKGATGTSKPQSSASTGKATNTGAASAAAGSAASSTATPSSAVTGGFGSNGFGTSASVTSATSGQSTGSKPATKKTAPGNGSRPPAVAGALADFHGSTGSAAGLAIVGILVLFVLLPGLVLLISGRSLPEVAGRADEEAAGRGHPPPGEPP